MCAVLLNDCLEDEMTVPTLEGITAKTITTERITTRVLFTGPEDGIPVIFLHGNITTATWWEETMLGLPTGYRGIAPDQRGFGDADIEKKIDATRGMGDLADDALALLDHLGIEKAHFVGNSLGGMVVWELMKTAHDRMLSVTQVDPGSPFGFGATRDAEGTPTTSDFAGSGGGLSNPELIKRMSEGDQSTESDFSPRSAIRSLLVKPPLVLEREDDLLASLLATHLGPQDLPGDFEKSSNWPFVVPGKFGPANATSPKYQRDVEWLYSIEPKPNVLWVRGSHDLVVSDTAASDPGFLGRYGLLPGWPGEEAYPPQPMIAQIRLVLEKYSQGGGNYKEVVIEDTGHVPFLEKPEEFNRVFHKHLASNNQ
jgi:pimeloyl-ACP methyl ester carboxylesterase